MDNTEIKKILYKEKPKAKLQFIRKGLAHYMASVSTCTINFEVPVSDMGDADFFIEMDGKLLNRWISNVTNKTIIESMSKKEYKEFLDIINEDENYISNPRYLELLEKQKNILFSKKDKFLKIIESGKMENKYEYTYGKLKSPILKEFADCWDRYQIIDFSDLLDTIYGDYYPDQGSTDILYEAFFEGSDELEFSEDPDYTLEDIIEMMDEVIKLGIARFQKDW